MLLTSFERIRRYIGDDEGNIKADNTVNRRELIGWISSVSNRIEKYLNRSIKIQGRTEYFDVSYRRRSYFPEAYPILSVGPVDFDSTGLWDGSEDTLTTDEYYIGSESNTIELVYGKDFIRKRGARIAYTGGLAYNGTKSIFAVNSGASFSTGTFVEGEDSLAMGIVSATGNTSLTVDNLYGIFEADEVINEYSDEDRTTATSVTANITAITQQSLAEAYPDISRAAEVEIRYMWKHKNDFENNTTTPDGVSTRGNDTKYTLQPETRALLSPYVRYVA